MKRIGFGCMRLHENNKRLVKYAIEHEINYFDVSPYYVNGNCEQIMKEALSGFDRDKFILTSKIYLPFIKTQADLELRLGTIYMGTVKITVVRHGQTDWNKNKILQGWEQTVLNREGIASVCSIAEYLYGQEYDMILTSDLLRAQQTAKIFSEKLNLPIQYLEHLRERYLGELQGTYEGYIQIPNPVESDMEPTLLFVRRIISIFKRMTLKYDYDKPLFVECINGAFRTISIL